jgi:hypothetical protein
MKVGRRLVYLRQLQDTNEVLFYALAAKHRRFLLVRSPDILNFMRMASDIATALYYTVSIPLREKRFTSQEACGTGRCSGR